jgi:hypothetical protein
LPFVLAVNGHGLAMWRHLKIVSPEPKPNRITNDEDNYKSSIVKVKPGLLLISEQNAENIFVARHIAKPPVVRRCFSFVRNQLLLICLLFFTF